MPGYFGAPRVEGNGLQILAGLGYRKIPRYADEMDPLDVAGEKAELEYEQALEKQELDWLKTNKVQ